MLSPTTAICRGMAMPVEQAAVAVLPVISVVISNRITRRVQVVLRAVLGTKMFLETAISVHKYLWKLVL